MSSPIIIACDYREKADLFTFVDNIDPSLCRLKIGKGMFTRFGPSLVRELVSRGFDIFLDLKFHDIPTTVYEAVSAARDLGVWMTNVHALGGREMLEYAAKATENSEMLLIAVTILTSFDENSLKAIRLPGTVKDNVLHLARLSNDSGLDGVVCSAEEPKFIKEKTREDFLCVTPGIRLKGDGADCQKRVVTPEDAIKNGSDYLVIGRSITRSNNPSETLSFILNGVGPQN